MSGLIDTELVARVVRLALLGRDHRDLVVEQIDREFIRASRAFFNKVMQAKQTSSSATTNWYENMLIRDSVDSQELAWGAGTNLKTISNKHGSSRRELVLDEARHHLASFRRLIDDLFDDSASVELALKNDASTVQLDNVETMTVLNALAVRRAGMRGGAWSSIGKQAEAPLMEALCRVFKVPEHRFSRRVDDDKARREVDFYLYRPVGRPVKCEVKLMGKGNPESADHTAARQTNVFVASTLSESTRNSLDENNIMWTELQTPFGLLRFQQTLGAYAIEHTPISEDEVAVSVERAVAETFPNIRTDSL